MSVQPEIVHSPAAGGGGVPEPDTSHELVAITLAALNVAMLRYGHLVGQCERCEPLRAADVDAARLQVERALELLGQLAEAVRAETTGLDQMLREYSMNWLTATGVAGAA